MEETCHHLLFMNWNWLIRLGHLLAASQLQW
jgi:hypothetical protein